ncbi:MAG: hypothetical protein ABIJ56_00405 [Pseudomonadota bacterium]
MMKKTLGALFAWGLFFAPLEAAAQEAEQENTAEACRDQKDNDGDGKIDCLDSNCGYLAFCKIKLESMKGDENTEETCSDSFDNDEDGFTDCYDQDCLYLHQCMEQTKAAPAPPPAPENTLEACRDGRDNDGDARVDCADSECAIYTICIAPVPILQECTATGECGIGYSCMNRRCVKTAPVSNRVASGRGHFISGLVISISGLVLLAAAVGVGYTWEAEELPPGVEREGYPDDMIKTVAPIGGVGGILTLVGNGVALGGLLRVSWSAGNVRAPRPLASLIIGWILWGLTVGSAVVMGGLESRYDMIDGPFFIPLLACGAATMFVVAIGYAAGWGNVKEALDKEKAEEEKKKENEASVTLMPNITPVRGGAMAGLTITF